MSSSSDLKTRTKSETKLLVHLGLRMIARNCSDLEMNKDRENREVTSLSLDMSDFLAQRLRKKLPSSSTSHNFSASTNKRPLQSNQFHFTLSFRSE